MLPSPRSWSSWCLALGLMLLTTACSRKPLRGAGEDHAEADAETETDRESDAEADEPEQPVDASANEQDATLTPSDADTPSSTEDAAAGPDSTIASAKDATAPLDAPTEEAGGSDASPLDASTAPLEAGEACQATKVMATATTAAPVDFVWVVDSSASMFDEQVRLRNALNSFVERVAQSQLDVRVIMVSRTPTLTPTGVGIPPGLCPDLPPDPLHGHPFASDPRYHFVPTYVDSAAVLRVAISQYPSYAGLLRPGSAVHFLAATDDEADYTGGAAQFVTDMKNLLGRTFHFHTFASPGPAPCTPTECKPDVDAGSVCTFLSINCRAANVGATCYQLASLTNGVAVSICELDWKPGLQAIFERVAESVPGGCSYAIPPPPRGVFNPGKLNIELTTQGSSQGTMLPALGSGGVCGERQACATKMATRASGCVPKPARAWSRATA